MPIDTDKLRKCISYPLNHRFHITKWDRFNNCPCYFWTGITNLYNLGANQITSGNNAAVLDAAIKATLGGQQASTDLLGVLGQTGLNAQQIAQFGKAMQGASGALVLMQPAEPVFWATDDGRPASEIAISAITT